MVLLKNDHGLLPLDRNTLKSVALIGPFAVRQMTGGGGSSHVIPLYSVAPVDGLDQALLSQTRISLQDGSDVDAAIAAAKRANVAIVMVGDDETESRDHSIELPASQNALIEAVAKANPRTVVVLKSGSALLMPWIEDVPAVLEAWYPGEEDGNAVADVLLGKVNPSGKLPLTFPRSVADTFAKNPGQFPGDGTTVHYSEDLEVGYRAVNAQHLAPLFPFGFGLSYTSFRFDDLAANATQGKPEAVVRFRVTNTGKRAGAEVAQFYLTYPSIAEGDEPPRQLKGFQKVLLQPGQSRTIEMKLNARTFSFWSVKAHNWQVVPGEFKIFVGDSSADLPLSGTVEIHPF